MNDRTEARKPLIERHETGPRFSEMTVADLGSCRMAFISGQVAEDGGLDITGQTRQVLSFIDRLLRSVGARREDIVSARIHLASPGDYAEMNAVWDDWVPPGRAPARTTLATRLMRAAYKVEIDATAVFHPGMTGVTDEAR